MADRPRPLSEILEPLRAERLKRGASNARDSSAVDDPLLVYLGNWQDPCPRRLLLDPDLEPVDIVTWQVIRIHAEPGKPVAFPTYVDLMRWVKVSRATVARALAVLRLTRWLPRYAAFRDRQGRFAGNVYALSDEPLPLSEMLGLDADYLAFTERASQHRNAHVRALANAVLEACHAAATAPTARGLEAVGLGEHLEQRLVEMSDLLSVFGASKDAHPEDDRQPPLHRVQNLNAADRIQNLNAVCSSSKKKTTTTTPTTRKVNSSSASSSPEFRTARTGDSVVFPGSLSFTDSQRRLLELRLALLAPRLRQDVLDEAQARILAKRSTADPVRCEFDYVARLCSRALEGAFVLTDAGERVRRARAQRELAEQRLERARAQSETRRLQELEDYKLRTKPKINSEE